MSDLNSLGQPVGRVESPAALDALREALAAQTAIAVDTEADSLYSYFEKVCLLQFSTRDADYIVDPLALSLETLAPIFADTQIEKVFHAAEYDVLCLKRDYHFTFANIFDTMIAARILGWKNIGLGNTLHERFGIVLNKKFQRADWGHRPLSAEQLAYAREDTHYLLALRDVQMAELEQQGRLEEAREEFDRLTRVEPTPRQFDPDAYWNITGARDLDPARLGVLRELFRWRDAQARKEDRPPFKVIPDATLLRIADARPQSTRALAHLGISDFVMRRYSQPLIAAVARGGATPQSARPHPHSRNENFLDNAARNRLGKLKEWRKARALARGVENDVIVSNDVLNNIARKNPRTLDALVAATGLGPWKTRAYGEEMLEVLHGKRG
ncbi:MAG: HRDC domain-containing protein [Anaerolineales bacterium]|nr:HRDC domain-containing protein [Anaerolineales bacterium]